MKCIRHNQIDAVAVCTYCGSGICPACVQKTDSGRIVCSPECKEGVASILVRRKSTPQSRIRGGVFLLVLGALFAAASAKDVSQWISTGQPPDSLLLIILAVIFLFAGCSAIIRAQGNGDRRL